MADTRQVAVIGAGYWGKNLVRNFDSLGALGMICDNRKELLGEYEDIFHILSRGVGSARTAA
ncbi:hypothetical protein ACFL0H_00800 [Thermodesulfobacteriota bacterium]